MKKQILYSIIYILFIQNIIAQQTPAPKQKNDYSIIGATAHIGNGKIIKNSLILLSNGKITYVGKNNSLKKNGIIINAKGKHVYPGFIVANSSLGLTEIDAVRATKDDDETGSMLPHIRSIIAYNAESKIIETMRPNGVLIGQITPRGGIISGTSSIVQFDAWNWEDALIKENDAIHINWPRNFTRDFSLKKTNSSIIQSKDYQKNVEKIENFFNDAKNYLASNKKIKNLDFEATKGLFENIQKVFIHVNGSKSIKDAIDLFKKLNINKIVIVKGKGAEKIADYLKLNNIPVILERSHRLPDNEDEDYDLPYRSAKILSDAGILVGLGMGMTGRMERMSSRNLPFYAGTYAAYGLGKEQALKLITYNNAKILGIDKKFGSLEVGKDATLFISKGDALEMKGNILTDAFIQGRKISLETHQTKLWKRYSNKYKNQ